MTGAPAPQPGPDSPRTLPITTAVRLPEPQPSRFVAPEPAESAKPARFPARAVAVTFVAAILAGLLLGVGYVRLRPPTIDPATQVSTLAAGNATVGLASPQEASRTYFAALANGRLDEALTLGELAGDGSTALLTPEAFAATRELAGISELKIMTRDEGAATVEVSYLLGDAQTTTNVPVERLPDGTYRLARTTATVELGGPGEGLIPVRLNGVAIDDGPQVELVPGRYEPTTGLAFLNYAGSSQFAVAELSAEPRVVELTPELTQAGQLALLAAASQSLTDCLTAKSLAPDGCPMAVAAEDVDPASIAWSLLGDPWGGATLGLDPEDPTVGQVSVPLELAVTYQHTTGRTVRENLSLTAVAKAGLLGQREAGLKVVWEA